MKAKMERWGWLTTPRVRQRGHLHFTMKYTILMGGKKQQRFRDVERDRANRITHEPQSPHDRIVEYERKETMNKMGGKRELTHINEWHCFCGCSFASVHISSWPLRVWLENITCFPNEASSTSKEGGISRWFDLAINDKVELTTCARV